MNLYRNSRSWGSCSSCQYELKPSLLYPRERERVIDDFVLFCFMVGNDFLPHPKATDIKEGGLDRLMNCYKQYLRVNQLLLRKKLEGYKGEKPGG